jgi:hypothetical protein
MYSLIERGRDECGKIEMSVFGSQLLKDLVMIMTDFLLLYGYILDGLISGVEVRFKFS